MRFARAWANSPRPSALGTPDPMNDLGDFYKNIVGKSTAGTLVKAGVGGLVNLIVNKAAGAAVIGLYDGTSLSGSKIGTVTLPSTLAVGSRPYGALFNSGLMITVSSSLVDLTVTYR